MKEFPQNIKFKYGWRTYQRRVLDNLNEHLQNGHLHVIAPPGSGKTVLGLEAAIRINQPTLILAPTIAIRNQWIQKFCELFLQTEIVPDWISRDVRKPEFLTVITYQGLHAACNNFKITEPETEEEEEEAHSEITITTNSYLEHVLAGLNAKHIKTVVVDEAHHLKNEWWHTLIKIKESLQPLIIGLTATPPYDVSANEWQRYIDLNGAIDIEISVPELVIEGDLCPHQDYAYLTHPTENELISISKFRDATEKLFHELKADTILVEAIKNHPVWVNPLENLDWIYTNLAYYSACLIYLNASGAIIEKSHLEIIDDKEFKIPTFNYHWAEILLSFYLYKDKLHFAAYYEHQKNTEHKLRRAGIIEKNQICFLENKQTTSSLSSSVSKLNGIKKIIDFEYGHLQHSMRLVVLTDYIRKEYYTNIATNSFELNKIGVITIFEKLRRDNYAGIKIGVLTGSMVIIPKSAYPLFQLIVNRCGLNGIICNEVPFDGNYLLIEECEALKNEIVNIITQIFEQGEIEVLIGTKSLLGEGWDAPAINALILASFVGSFVLSNQMRGRAIRSQKGNLSKTGNIWHLCCIDPTSTTGGSDFDLLRRRFKTFVGITVNNTAQIENGISRLNIEGDFHFKESIENKNNQTFIYAANRSALIDNWKAALQNGISLTEEIKLPFSHDKNYTAVKTFYLNKTIKNFFAVLALGFLDYLWGTIQSLSRMRGLKSLHDLYMYLSVLGIIGVILFGHRTFKAFRLYIKYRDIAKDIKTIGDALLNTLIKIDIMKTPGEKLTVNSSMDRFGTVYCHLDGGSTHEKSVFVGMLQEIIEPVGNPRYIIIRRNIFMLFVKQKDFHSVPEHIGKNQTWATYFKNEWQKYVGTCDLVFTRTIEGRKILLQARIKSLAAQFDHKAERVSRWE